MCSSGWHPDLTCQENGKKLYLQSKTGEGNNQSVGAIDPLLLFEMDDNIKRCPMCHVPIERDAGCAQMMCKRCKHVFCWFCLKSLDVSTYHCAVRMVSIVHQTTMWIVIYEKIAFSMYNSNLLSEIMNGLSHILYQIKKYKK